MLGMNVSTNGVPDVFLDLTALFPDVHFDG